MEDGKVMINIIYEDNHLLVVEKPVNVPVQADITKDKDLLTILKEYIKNKYNKPGNVYLGLVHRLDRPVGGIMVFAKTSKAANRLSKQVQDKTMKKTYIAVVQGKLQQEGTLKDKLEKDSKNNITRVSKNGKEAILNYKLLQYKSNYSLVQINLITGRSHQIRVQFSSRNHPLFADQKYNKNPEKGQIALFAKKLEFIHPVTKETMAFELPLPDRHPYTMFN